VSYPERPFVAFQVLPEPITYSYSWHSHVEAPDQPCVVYRGHEQARILAMTNAGSVWPVVGNGTVDSDSNNIILFAFCPYVSEEENKCPATHKVGTCGLPGHAPKAATS
jgi:hypothetical protein